MQDSVNVLNNDGDDSSNPTEARNGTDIDLMNSANADSFREKISECIRNKGPGAPFVSDRNVRPASLPIKKCFNYNEDGAGVGSGSQGEALLSVSQSQRTEATFLSPSEGQFWKRYAEVSKFTKDNSNGNSINSGGADSAAKNRRRSDTSFMLAKQRLSSFGVGEHSTTNAETMDDDLAPLLPSKRELSQEDIYQSQTSLVSSSEGGILAEGEETSSESQASENSRSPACVLGLVERLLRTHPVWFLPGIQRSGAVHLLQGKEEGNFIVRGSSQSKTMAVSVRLPLDNGPYIEHYLIQSNEGLLSLESSRFKFDSIPALIAHYSQCCDELPVQLCLPKALREAKNRQQLSSLALLGQEFWRYPMASPKPKTVLSANSSHLNTPSDATQSSGIGLTFNNNRNLSSFNHFGPENNPNFAGPSETPTDTISTMSSFTIGQGHQLLSPESIDSAVIMSPSDPNQTGIIGKTSTFKSKRPLPSPTLASSDVEKQIEIFNANLFGSTDSKIGETVNADTLERQLKTPRPTPPNTLNIKPIRSPPAPPARRLKPPSAASTPNTESNSTFSNNITVTTTVTFSVDNHTNTQIIELVSPNETNNNGNSKGFSTFQSSLKRLPPDGECHIPGSLFRNPDADDGRASDPEGNLLAIQSPLGGSNGNQQSFRKHTKMESSLGLIHSARTSRRYKRKESKHYQESDILESPSVYCRSNLGDKISDYEDLWTQDSNGNTTLIKGDKLSTFKPELDKSLDPLSPAQETFHTSIHERSFASYNPTIPADGPKPSLMSSFSSSENFIQLRQHRDASSDRSTPTEQHHRNVLKTFSPTPTHEKPIHNPMLEPRYRMGFCFPNTATSRCDPNGNNDHSRTQTPSPLLINGGAAPPSKQDSPFYADPADVLNSIVRRSPFNRPQMLLSNQRHSEPPKQLLMDPNLPLMWASAEQDVRLKNQLAASLDELKNPRSMQQHQQNQPQPQPHSRIVQADRLNFDRLSLEQTENNDYDNDLRWMKEHAKSKSPQPPTDSGGAGGQRSVKILPPDDGRTITVHQIIAKRLPHLDLPEFPANSNGSSDATRNKDNENSKGTLSRTQRKSAYDNVEKQAAGYATSLLNSAQSDDGTVFSEPWDSSQWDTFLPQDNNADTMPVGDIQAGSALCGGVGGGGRLSERYGSRNELSSYNSMSLRRNGQSKKCSVVSQKVATILRSRSCRDREILCHPRNKTVFSGPGESIGTYALSLADDTESTFSRNISNFISCTKESKAAPQVVMRNMRQFMSGMKNYLVKHGEGEFANEVQKARSQLKSDEFLNLDSILEEVMHRLVILPLREHLYGLFVDYYTQSGDIQLLVEKVKQACGRGPSVFGIKNTVTPPSASALRQISALFVRLQETELPLEKLDILLTAVSTIFEATCCCNGQQLSADDFLPVLVLVVAHCGFIGAEIEAEYMWGLIQPSLLSGEAGYYLTALCSAVHVLKNFSLHEHEGISGSMEWNSSTLPECSSVLRVIIPDEYNGSIQTRTLPIRPHTTTREVCRIIAHKARITNAQDYGLFKLIDGEETLLQDNECPQDVRMAACGRHCMIAYKRVDAKIAWPTVMPTSLTTDNQ